MQATASNGCGATIAARLRWLRRERNLTQMEMAKALGLSSVSYVSKLEHGQPIGEVTFDRVCKYFCVDPKWLKMGIGDAPVMPEPVPEKFAQVVVSKDGDVVPPSGTVNAPRLAILERDELLRRVITAVLDPETAGKAAKVMGALGISEERATTVVVKELLISQGIDPDRDRSGSFSR